MLYLYAANRFFTKELLQCPCCNKYHFSRSALRLLLKARIKANIPFKINSAFRCWRHNAKVGGVPDSSHLTGHAVDIRCTSDSNRYIIVNALLSSGYTRIGIHKAYIHADCDPDKPILVIWVY